MYPGAEGSISMIDKLPPGRRILAASAKICRGWWRPNGDERMQGGRTRGSYIRCINTNVAILRRQNSRDSLWRTVQIVRSPEEIENDKMDATRKHKLFISAMGIGSGLRSPQRDDDGPVNKARPSG